MISDHDPNQFSTSLPQRQTLISQMALLLQESIQRGSWKEKLPAERTLCAQFQISRNTLRAALQRLQRDRIVRLVHGSGNYIVGAPPRPRTRKKARDIALISPEPLARLRPSQTLWIDELRALLSERGLHLHVFHGRQWFRPKPDRALQRLVSENPHRCWILTMANEALQTWFSHQRIRCVVAGTAYAGIDLHQGRRARRRRDGTSPDDRCRRTGRPGREFSLGKPAPDSFYRILRNTSALP